MRRRLKLRLSVATVRRMLKRHSWSWQAPARRALERDEHAAGPRSPPCAATNRAWEAVSSTGRQAASRLAPFQARSVVLRTTVR
ncbi:winged helix-turn-helix domain-containing protein [Streptomyces sp. NPDC005898]|uniref:winged helix-turn-helix domain-containing protein n=1 Tax=Streptomyces sp. NPDC005898 TaxID=3157082 RepID=UPI00340C34AF